MPKGRVLRMAVCHPNRRDVARSLCSSCYQRTLWNENPALYKKALETRRAYYQRRRSLVPQLLNQQRRNDYYKRNFGITVKGYQELYVAQKGICLLCDKWHPQGTSNGLQVDHCHMTKKIRGLLCGICNQHLGFLEKFIDTPVWTFRAKSYVLRDE